MIRDVTDLEIYKMSLKLLKQVCEFTRKLPLSEFNTKKQIEKSIESIPSNIAEGFAKKHSEKKFKRFLKIALKSSDETVSYLRIIAIKRPNLTNQAQNLAVKYKNLSARINKLIQVWKKY